MDGLFIPPLYGLRGVLSVTFSSASPSSSSTMGSMAGASGKGNIVAGASGRGVMAAVIGSWRASSYTGGGMAGLVS